MSRSERSPDVIVVGAGIVGAACAYFLCRAGLRVCLAERQAPCAGTSGACDGMLLLWDKLPGAELELGKLSVELWSRLGEELAA
ncbi:MAG: FAD-binding oxidoreductase, partial [Chloroflexi bacterium]|nr:FAD-binding oxidoreductase [Chloroflexota bacterium]